MAKTPDIIVPQKIQTVVKEGFERLKFYRNATAMFVREYVGNYYRQNSGVMGEQPLNLMFHVVRTVVPNLVSDNPVNLITTPYTQYKSYAELLSLGLNSIEEQMKLKDILRGWIVQALFGMGIVKIGLAESDDLMPFGDIRIDPGQIYVKLVSLCNFVMDPICGSWGEASFMGHRTMVPRQLLLDIDGYDHDLVMKLPVSDILKTDKSKLADMTRLQSGKQEMVSLQDMVDVVEIWVPEANALVTIPDPYQITFDKYIRIEDYYGPKEGPYINLAFTPPVEDNPLPIAPASIWFDLHRLANTVFKKTIDQALSQKDLVFYNPSQADEADSAREAETNEWIASTDPKGIQQISLGGQNRSNEVFLQELQIFFNYMAANPDQMSGNMTPSTGGGRQTATQSSILQGNASISIEDARQIIYDKTAEISRRMAWYMHTDPFIDLPLIKRSVGGEEQQLRLTPDQRRGSFLDFVFNIKARSMSRLDPNVRSERIIKFCTNVLPSLVTTAQTAMQTGVPFNLMKAAIDIGNELGIGEWVTDIFNDPEYEQKLQLMLMLGPQNSGKAGGGPNSMKGIQQNGGYSQNRAVPNQGQEFNQNAQAGANEGQASMQGMF